MRHVNEFRVARHLFDDVVADHRRMVAERAHYDLRPLPTLRGALALVRDLVTHVGFQQLTVFRCATALHRVGLDPLAMIVCRIIRFVYGAEMHWASDLAPGILLVHGNGIVISRDAHISTGCVIFPNVTIGMSRDAEGRDGAPVLLENVHVGVGATLLGPITIGPETKIGSNAVVLTSIGPHMSVMASEPHISSRSTTGRLDAV